MSRIAVIYATKTGHSEKLAKAVAQAVGCAAYNAVNISMPINADLLFLVGGIYAGKSHPEMIRFAESLGGSAGKKAVLITTSVSVSNRSQPDIRRILSEAGIKILDEHACAGSLLFLKSGHPDTEDIAEIVRRAIEIKNQFENPNP
ncbi:flavodoxin domain-containing protein [Oscillospiraceae bacterium WX1]